VNWLTSEVITLFHFHHLAFNDVAFFDQKADILRTLFRDHPRGLEVLEKTLRYLFYRPAPFCQRANLPNPFPALILRSTATR
jgi:hypothetical protein